MITRRRFLQLSAAGLSCTVTPELAAGQAATKRDPLLGVDGVGLAKLVKSGEVSPKELVEAAILRIEALDGRLNAIVTPTFERALERAKTIVPHGPFAGVPYLLKDNLDLAGVRTTHGSKFFQHHIAAASAPLIPALEAAGLNLLGKTNMPEVGLIPTTESDLLGACQNPWNPSHSAGGSSGGSAAAVAAGYVPFAHATDGGGSIRIPSSCCGLFGLKPSRRRMLWGSTNQADFAVDHCTSRSVRDSAQLFALTQDRSPDASFEPIEFVSAPGKRRLRIGLTMKNYFGRMPHPDVTAALESTAKLCESLGHTVVEADHPVNGSEFEQHFFALFSTRIMKLIQQVESATGKPVPETQLLGRFTYDFGLQGEKLPDDAVEKARQYMEMLGRQVSEWMASIDVLLTPVVSTPPPKLGTLYDPTQDYDVMSRRVFDYLPYTPIQNALGMPAMSVPLGMSSDGLPIGSHFIARAGEERTLFELAYELERAKPWASRWAPLSAATLA